MNRSCKIPVSTKHSPGSRPPENSIIRGNCLDVMADIPDGSVDLVATDPPYAQGFTHNGKKADFSDLDLVCPFFDRFYAELARILKSGGEVFLFCDWRSIALHLPVASEHLDVRNCIVWNKISGPGSYYSFVYEFLLWMHPRDYVPGFRKGSNIWTIPGFGNRARKTNGSKVHPTQKPIELMEKIIQEGSQEGGLVLDPFAGSGTTAMACRRLKRKFICIEKQKRFFRIAVERAARETPPEVVLIPG